MNEKIFIVPNNDLEAKAIIKLLKCNNYKEGENLFITNQAWGASWDNLEPEIKTQIENIHKGHNMPNIYGIELQGKAPYNNIDHHVYDGDDRSNAKASIEQVAELIGVELSIQQQFIAANDKGFIPAMEKLADSISMTDDKKEDMIQRIRQMDRIAQGITQEQEEQAVEAINSLHRQENGLFIINLPHSKCATITDRLYGQYDNMLIVCGDGELDFYGEGKICKKLQEQFQGWAGGDLDNSGFWGGYANPEDVKNAINELIPNKCLKDKIKEMKLPEIGKTNIDTEDLII